MLVVSLGDEFYFLSGLACLLGCIHWSLGLLKCKVPSWWRQRLGLLFPSRIAHQAVSNVQSWWYQPPWGHWNGTLPAYPARCCVEVWALQAQHSTVLHCFCVHNYNTVSQNKLPGGPSKSIIYNAVLCTQQGRGLSGHPRKVLQPASINLSCVICFQSSW